MKIPKHQFNFRYRDTDHRYVMAFALFMSIFLMIFLFWNRFIRDRLPRDIPGEPNILRLFFLSYALIVVLLYFIISLIYLRKFLKRNFAPGFISKILQKFPIISKIRDTVEKLREYVLPKPTLFWWYVFARFFVPEYGTLPFRRRYIFYPLLHLGYRFMHLFYPRGPLQRGISKYPLKLYIAVLLISVLPRVICSTIFLYEVTILHHVELFYKCVLLWLIPYIFNNMIMMYRAMVDVELKILENDPAPGAIPLLQIIPMPGDNEMVYLIKGDPRYDEEVFQETARYFFEVNDFSIFLDKRLFFVLYTLRIYMAPIYSIMLIIPLGFWLFKAIYPN